MAKFEYKNGSEEVRVEVTDVWLVVSVLGLAGAVLLGIYLITKDQETLRQLAEIAISRNAVLTEGGRRVLNG